MMVSCAKRLCRSASTATKALIIIPGAHDYSSGNSGICRMVVQCMLLEVFKHFANTLATLCWSQPLRGPRAAVPAGVTLRLNPTEGLSHQGWIFLSQAQLFLTL